MKKIIIYLIVVFNTLFAVADDSQMFVDYIGQYYSTDSLRNRLSNNKKHFLFDYLDSVVSPVEKDGFWGVVDVNGKEIVPCIYEIVDNIAFLWFRNDTLQFIGKGSDYILCKKAHKYFVYDSEGNIILKNCSRVTNLNYGNILFCKRKNVRLYSIIDNKTYKVDRKLRSNSLFSQFDVNGTSIVVRFVNPNTKYVSYLFGAINTKGEYAVPCIYEDEEEVMKIVGKTERSFKYLKNK